MNLPYSQSYLTCNMGTHDLPDMPDMHGLSAWALGIHIRQTPCSHVTKTNASK